MTDHEIDCDMLTAENELRHHQHNKAAFQFNLTLGISCDARRDFEGLLLYTERKLLEAKARKAALLELRQNA